MGAQPNSIYGLFMSKNVRGMHDGECMVMSIVHDKQRRGEKTKRKNCVKSEELEHGRGESEDEPRPTVKARTSAHKISKGWNIAKLPFAPDVSNVGHGHS